jgi:hypothetical protein
MFVYYKTPTNRHRHVLHERVATSTKTAWASRYVYCVSRTYYLDTLIAYFAIHTYLKNSSAFIDNVLEVRNAKVLIILKIRKDM